MSLPIDTPLPLAAKNQPAPAFDPMIQDLVARKLNALWNMRGAGRVKVSKSDGAVVIELMPAQ